MNKTTTTQIYTATQPIHHFAAEAGVQAAFAFDVVAKSQATGLEPENTLWAMQRAMDMGCNGFATHVRLSADGVPVLMQDESVDRTTDGRGAVGDLSLSVLLRLDAGMGERIPTLDQAFDLTRGHLRLFLELHELATAAVTVRWIRDRGLADLVTLVSANCAILSMVDSLRLRIPVEYRVADATPEALYRALLDRAKRISCPAERLTPAFVSHVHDAGLRVGVWGDTLDAIAHGVMMGADYLVTGRVDIALAFAGMLRTLPYPPTKALGNWTSVGVPSEIYMSELYAL